MALWLTQALGIISGSLVGWSLGLVGGGGSILAVPCARTTHSDRHKRNRSRSDCSH